MTAATQPISMPGPKWLSPAAAAAPIGGVACMAVLSIAKSLPCMADGASRIRSVCAQAVIGADTKPSADHRDDCAGRGGNDQRQDDHSGGELADQDGRHQRPPPVPAGQQRGRDEFATGERCDEVAVAAGAEPDRGRPVRQEHQEHALADIEQREHRGDRAQHGPAQHEPDHVGQAGGLRAASAAVGMGRGLTVRSSAAKTR